MKKAHAKADEEAQAEIKKYKSLYDTGAKRIARFQQEVECQKIALDRHERQKKELQGKVSLLQDQLESIRTRSVRAPTCTAVVTPNPINIPEASTIKVPFMAPIESLTWNITRWHRWNAFWKTRLLFPLAFSTISR